LNVDQPPQPDSPPPTDLRARRFDDVVVPPAVVASPSEMPGDPTAEPRWWRPTWREGLPHLGYRWLYLAPSVIVVAALGGSMVLPGVRSLLLVIGVKLGIFMAAVAITLAARGVRLAARARREPFCIHCGYNLTGLPDHHTCPECGQPYSWRVIEEYRRDPDWFILRWHERHRLPPPGATLDAGAVRGRKRRDGT